jgi:hypothetical protein
VQTTHLGLAALWPRRHNKIEPERARGQLGTRRRDPLLTGPTLARHNCVVLVGERSMARFSSFPIAALGLLAVPIPLVTAQTSQAPQRTVTVADRYEPVFDAFRHMAPQADRVATVRPATGVAA